MLHFAVDDPSAVPLPCTSFLRAATLLFDKTIKPLHAELSSNEARYHPLPPSYAEKWNAMLPQLQPRKCHRLDGVGTEEEVEQSILNPCCRFQGVRSAGENIIVQR